MSTGSLAAVLVELDEHVDEWCMSPAATPVELDEIAATLEHRADRLRVAANRRRGIPVGMTGLGDCDGDL